VGQDDQSLGFRCAEALKIAPPWPKLTLLACLAGKLELLSEKTNAHSGPVYSVAFSPDGTKIVSGSHDKTIKVWDSGAPRAQNRPSSAKTNACWLAWQTSWSC
jgi:WD40 repeat protein